MSATEPNNNLSFATFSKDFDIKSFQSGEEMIDRFLRQGLALQQTKRNQTRVTVTTEPGTNRVIGYFAINAHAVHKQELPKAFFEQSPETAIKDQPPLGAIFLSRFGVSADYQGKGIGRELLRHALDECLSLSDRLGVFCIVLDALNTKAAQMYERRGFVQRGEGAGIPRYYYHIRKLIELRARFEAAKLSEMPSAQAMSTTANPPGAR